MSKRVVLDASAILALIQQDPGAAVLQPLLKDAVMSAVNLAESLTVLQRVQISPSEGLLFIQEIIECIIPFDLEQAKIAAALQPQVRNQGLSLGDRSCIALGIKLEAPIYTADKIWGSLNLSNVQIHVIR